MVLRVFAPCVWAPSARLRPCAVRSAAKLLTRKPCTRPRRVAAGGAPAARQAPPRPRRAHNLLSSLGRQASAQNVQVQMIGVVTPTLPTLMSSLLNLVTNLNTVPGVVARNVVTPVAVLPGKRSAGICG